MGFSNLSWPACRRLDRTCLVRLVDLAPYGFVLEPRYWFYGWSRSPRMRLRRAVSDRLLRARETLPAGWNFKIWDGYRTYATHVRMVESFRKRLACACPELSARRRENLLWRYAGRVRKRVTRPDTHRNGGAVDLTLLDARGQELDLGTDHDALVPEAALDFFDRIRRPDPGQREIRDNRRILARAMAGAGFLRYPPEWWHWSSREPSPFPSV